MKRVMVKLRIEEGHQGIDVLLTAVAEALPPDRKQVKLLLPFSKGALAEQCRRDGQVEYEEYVPEGLSMNYTGQLFADFAGGALDVEGFVNAMVSVVDSAIE